MTTKTELTLSTMERLFALFSALGAESDCAVRLQNLQDYEIYRIASHCSPLLQERDVHVLVTCLDEYVGLQDIRDHLEVIFPNDENVLLPFGRTVSDLKTLNSVLKERLAVYTLRHGFCRAMPQHGLAGMIFYIDYVFYVDGKAHIVTLFQGSKHAPETE